MSRKTSRAEARRRARQGRSVSTQPGALGRTQLLIAGIVALAVVGGLIWVSNNNFAATPTPTATASTAPTGSGVAAQPGTHVRGDASAPVTIEEWADFQCPACGQFARLTEPQLFQSYVNTGRVRYVFHQFAFLGPESTWAAQASECAADQGKFWEYHEKLYASQAGENKGAFSKDNLKKFGADLGLGAQFAQCIDSGRHNDEVATSVQTGQQLGVNSTPTLFINGKKYTGAYPYDQLKAIIDPLLSK